MKEQSQNNSSSEFLKTDGGKSKTNSIEIPSISLPKGGGAIKGIDEKFSVNAVNGTASFSIPLPFSPARGASPSLSLSYNSGAGNGIFGLGWNLSLSSIKRKTDKGLPKYFDNIDSDIFLFSEAEDLVPEFEKGVDGRYIKEPNGKYRIFEKDFPDTTNKIYKIRFYRPRIEGLFARIERWTEISSGKIKWRVISKDNVTTLFGWSENSRISDPTDIFRIFEWMPEFVFDDKGNCAHYIYKKEDDKKIDLSLLHNRNRLVNSKITYTNLYLEKILYGNKNSYKKFGNIFPDETEYLFSTVFDYGEYEINSPYNKTEDWNFRTDVFSDYKAGFEIRTSRLCNRVLLFHHFDEYDGLVKSLNFNYDTNTQEDFTFLKSITAHGYIKTGTDSYSQKNLPPIEFTYQKHDWNKEVKSISTENLVHAPSGLDEQQYQFTDLFNEGLSGILTEQANGWYYKHNLGDGKFEQAKLVTPKPSFAGLGGQLQLADLDADGGRQLVSYGEEPKGYFELDDENEWQPFRNFQNLPNVNFGDANARMIDLNGDGKPEILISEDNIFTWYPSEGRNGYYQAQTTPKSYDEELGPHIIFADQEQTIFLADMSGDGMTDIVRIRNGEVCYWPNLGYGKFGAKVAMDNVPLFDHPDSFNASSLRLADIDGSGTTDIIYLGKNKFSCWSNLSGNSFSTAPFEIDAFPEIHNHAKITVTDLLGNGVACIVWSSPLSKDVNAPLRYIDLMNSKKPHIMIAYKNNMGKEVSMEYKPSTWFYIEDKQAGKPWVTKLHFPVHCVSKTESLDKISGWRFVISYKYHHGYYDHPEREFRGFGMVEQTDNEDFELWKLSGATNITDLGLHQAPVISKTWTHTGAFLGIDRILDQFEQEYWYQELKRFELANQTNVNVDSDEYNLPPARIIDESGKDLISTGQLSAEDWQEALRACKGMALRSEIFAEDAKNQTDINELRKELKPYSVATHNCVIQRLQPRGQNQNAIFIVKESEAITYSYERDLKDPRIAHNLNISFDEYANVLESASVVYPRKNRDSILPEATQNAQNETHIIYVENTFTNDVDVRIQPIKQDLYRLRLPAEVKTYQLKGLTIGGGYYKIENFIDILSTAKSTEAKYHEYNKPLVTGKSQWRLIEHIRTMYRNNNLIDPLPFGEMHSLGIPYGSYQLAYTKDLLHQIYHLKKSDSELVNLMVEGKFVPSDSDTRWWIPSGTTNFFDAANPDANTLAKAQTRFYLPISYTDPYGSKTKVNYESKYQLFIKETEDEMGNKSAVDVFNYRTLSPKRMRDINDNFSEAISDELGLVKAMAVMGKGDEADEMGTLSEETTAAEHAALNDIFAIADADGVCDSIALYTEAKSLLQNATTRFVYNFDAYTQQGKPTVVASIVREQHFKDKPDSPVQLSFEYSNGLGKVIMKKVQAEPGKAKQVLVNAGSTVTITEPDTDGTTPKQLRWIGNGRTILNNKGNAVKQYEPFFSVSPKFEDEQELVETGVTPIMYYDAMGRLITTEMPDGSFSKVEFNSWEQIVYDQNDTVKESQWYVDRGSPDPEGPEPLNNPERRAAWLAAKHAKTPFQLHFDTLGRPVLQLENNGKDLTNRDILFSTKIELDIEGNLRKVTDARENTVMEYSYDMIGNNVYQKSMDAGQRWLLINILGNPLRTWDERDHEFQYFYDILHRPIFSIVKGGDIPGVTLNHVFDRIFYGENEPDDKQKNLRGKPIRHYDTGGFVETPEYDFKGQPISSTRKLFTKYKEVANWADPIAQNDLENTAFTFKTEFDALGRITKQTAPDESIITPSYNEAGLLYSETVVHINPAVTTEYIKDIEYNEKGQRNYIKYGNGVKTTFEYDTQTFRLTHLKSNKNTKTLQDLYYTYDPVGNILRIEDKANDTTFFSNMKVEPVCEYTYDALSRLTKATGRENNSIMNFNSKDNYNDATFMLQHTPGDPMAVTKYTQSYKYDEVGNIKEINHLNKWTRTYEYETINNRLINTKVGNEIYNYPHHSEHGYITLLPHLIKMGWNFKEELILTTRQNVTTSTPETTYYQYDGQGQRIRKITENQTSSDASPSKKEERIYIAGYETYRTYQANTINFERESLSLMDESHRFVMIETVKKNSKPAPIPSDVVGARVTRYQLHNHLGSATIELDATAQVVSYEEYHPYGTTAYQAKNKVIKCAAKRYRYTGMERDEETGLEYHSARYYVPWLGRWANSDPIGIGDGVNVYCYVRGNPKNHFDIIGKQSNTLGAIGEFNLWDVLESHNDRFTVFWDWGKNVNSPGFDIPVYDKEDDVVRFFDNKAYSGRIRDVSAFSDKRLQPNLRIARESIERFGGAGAEEALEALNKNRYELVVTNYYSKKTQSFSPKLFNTMTVLDAETGMFVKSEAEMLKARSLVRSGHNLSTSLGKANMGRLARFTAGGILFLASAASAESQISDATIQTAETLKRVVLSDIRRTLVIKAQMEDTNLLMIDDGRFVLDKSTGNLYGWDNDTDSPIETMKMKQIANLFLIDKGKVGNQGGNLVQIEYWTEGDTGIRVVHDRGSAKLTMIPPKD